MWARVDQRRLDARRTRVSAGDPRQPTAAADSPSPIVMRQTRATHGDRRRSRQLRPCGRSRPTTLDTAVNEADPAALGSVVALPALAACVIAAARPRPLRVRGRSHSGTYHRPGQARTAAPRSSAAAINSRRANAVNRRQSEAALGERGSTPGLGSDLALRARRRAKSERYVPPIWTGSCGGCSVAAVGCLRVGCRPRQLGAVVG